MNQPLRRSSLTRRLMLPWCSLVVACSSDAPSPEISTLPGVPVPMAERAGLSDANVLALMTGEVRITTDGATLRNLDIKGQVRIEANNVTLENCRIDGLGRDFALSVGGPTARHGLRLTHVELSNARLGLALGGPQGSRLDGGPEANRFEAVRIHHVGDGIHLGSDYTLTASHITTSYWPSNHADGIQISNRGNVVIQDSHIATPTAAFKAENPDTNFNAAVFLAQDFPGPIVNVRIERSFLDGGGHAFRQWKPKRQQAAYANPSNITVQNCWFGTSARWEPAIAYPGQDGSPTWNVNVSWPSLQPLDVVRR